MHFTFISVLSVCHFLLKESAILPIVVKRGSSKESSGVTTKQNLGINTSKPRLTWGLIIKGLLWDGCADLKHSSLKSRDRFHAAGMKAEGIQCANESSTHKARYEVFRLMLQCSEVLRLMLPTFCQKQHKKGTAYGPKVA